PPPRTPRKTPAPHFRNAGAGKDKAGPAVATLGTQITWRARRLGGTAIEDSAQENSKTCPSRHAGAIISTAASGAKGVRHSCLTQRTRWPSQGAIALCHDLHRDEGNGHTFLRVLMQLQHNRAD